MGGPPTDLETTSKPENGTRIGSDPRLRRLCSELEIAVVKAFRSETHTEKAY